MKPSLGTLSLCGRGGQMKHELKIWPQYYCRVADGSKTFEVRNNDRGFQPGDTVVLREWDPTIVTKEEPEGSYHQLQTPAVWQEAYGYTRKDPLNFVVGYVFPIDEKRVVFSLLTPRGEK